ncbi:MAG: hypothetical protein CMI54_01805 [Parcubacteria group bacterium]|nr:hypothetical protein [Parcubacteria group bacterium]|tara:strand:+ start:711 stop:905 length:195 start_codon:yes stop_codon:yes gene_type:complete
MKSVTTTTIDTEIKKAANKAGILFSKALEFGILFKLAERGYGEYPRNALSSKIERMAEHLNQNE